MIDSTTTTSAERTRRAGEQLRPGPLPPGQRLVDWFPRFGTHSDRPTPTIPDDPVVEIGGVVTEPFAVPVADLATLPRRRLDADFHCVSGWTAAGLRWDGVAFAEFYRLRIEPSLRPGVVVTHVKFCGLDGFGSVITIEDALDHDVLLADRFDGERLGNDHGAPLRSSARLNTATRARNKSLASTCTPWRRSAGPDRSYSMCFSTPTREQGSGRRAPRKVARPRRPAVLPRHRER